QVGGQFPRRGDAPLADPGALADPGIRGVEPFRQLVIGDDPLGQIGAATDDLGAQIHAVGYSAAGCGVGAAVLSRARSLWIFSRKPLTFISMATPIALAKPNASVEPWLLTAMPRSPRNIAPL